MSYSLKKKKLGKPAFFNTENCNAWVERVNKLFRGKSKRNILVDIFENAGH